MRRKAPVFPGQGLLGFSALPAQLVKQAGVEVLYGGDEGSRPGNLIQINLTRLVLFLVVLTLDQRGPAGRYDSASAPELQPILHPNPVNIGQVDGGLPCPALGEATPQPPWPPTGGSSTS